MPHIIAVLYVDVYMDMCCVEGGVWYIAGCDEVEGMRVSLYTVG